MVAHNVASSLMAAAAQATLSYGAVEIAATKLLHVYQLPNLYPSCFLKEAFSAYACAGANAIMTNVVQINTLITKY
jgi:hypothetical protein